MTEPFIHAHHTRVILLLYFVLYHDYENEINRIKSVFFGYEMMNAVVRLQSYAKLMEEKPAAE